MLGKVKGNTWPSLKSKKAANIQKAKIGQKIVFGR